MDVLCVLDCACLSSSGLDNSYFHLSHNAWWCSSLVIGNQAPSISALNMYHSLCTQASKLIINLIENKKGKLRVIFNHNTKRITIGKHDKPRTTHNMLTEKAFLKCTISPAIHVGTCTEKVLQACQVLGGHYTFQQNTELKLKKKKKNTESSVLT